MTQQTLNFLLHLPTLAVVLLFVIVLPYVVVLNPTVQKAKPLLMLRHPLNPQVNPLRLQKAHHLMDMRQLTLFKKAHQSVTE